MFPRTDWFAPTLTRPAPHDDAREASIFILAEKLRWTQRWGTGNARVPLLTTFWQFFQVCELLPSEGVQAHKKEGPKSMQRLVAKQERR